MIALIVALALCFAWGCIATAVAITQTQLRSDAAAVVVRQTLRISELEDRAQATSLSEYHAARAISMPAPKDEPLVTYRYDDFGVARDIAPPDNDE